MAALLRISVFIFIVTILSSCEGEPANPLLDPIVSIESSTLTKKELYDAIPANLSKEDSIIFAQNYIDRWIKTQLILRKAELNLSPKEKDVDQLLNDYRTSLLTHLYLQKLLEQKYSPLITSREIESYYTQMKDNFKLTEIIIKGVYIKIANSAPNLGNVEKWYSSDDQKELVSLEAYCYQNAVKYDAFFDNWISFDKINIELPNKIDNAENVLKWKRNFIENDESYKYYFSVRDIHFEGELAPLEYVSERIKSILLNKKRVEFIEQLEKDLMEEGEKQNLIKFH